ncbi:MAG: hypothetical protein OQL06_06865 [Gammaproteobacteria bacterium]|nr:hypothetical protein [Gammaproteobacteria bacterium]
MSIYWRKHPNLPDTELPQTIMRPFWHPVPDELDDNTFSIILTGERPVAIAIIILLLSVALFMASIFSIYNLYMHIGTHAFRWNAETAYYSVLTAVLLLTGTGLLFLFFKLVQIRKVVFDRHNHCIQYPQQGLLPRYHKKNYDDLNGKIIQLKNPFGKRIAKLILENPDTGHIISLYSTHKSPQALAGYWSFIVQYMKPDAPLPDVPLLHNYPNTTPGVLQKNTIDYS